MQQRPRPQSDGVDHDALARQLALFGVSLLQRNRSVSYGDFRFTSRAERTLAVKNGEVDRVTDSEDRVLSFRGEAFIMPGR